MSSCARPVEEGTSSRDKPEILTQRKRQSMHKCKTRRGSLEALALNHVTPMCVGMPIMLYVNKSNEVLLRMKQE